MKEAELKNLLLTIYPDQVPEDIHNAYRMAITSRKEKNVMKRKLALVPVLALLLAMALAATAAAVNYYSVTRYPKGDRETFLQHVITLDQHYSNELFDMSINDFVFDGQSIEMAMDIIRKDENVGYYMVMDLVAEDENGKTYTVDVEGYRGGDFMCGFYCPDLWETDPDRSDEDGFGFDGVVWDEDMNPPPDGTALTWTMTLTVLKPLWPMDVLPDTDYMTMDYREELLPLMQQAWRNQRILYTEGLVEYAFVAGETMGLADGTHRVKDLLVECGAFEAADTIVCTFSTEEQEAVQVEKMIGQRYNLGICDMVIDRLDVSFQRIIMEVHYDFGRLVTRDEVMSLDVPNWWNVQINGGSGGGLASISTGIDRVEGARGIWRMNISAYPEDAVETITLIPAEMNMDTGEKYMDEENSIVIRIEK